MLGEVVPVLRKEFQSLRPSHVPGGPTHARLKAAAETRRTEVSVSSGQQAPSA
jgi:hypothetical protein